MSRVPGSLVLAALLGGTLAGCGTGGTGAGPDASAVAVPGPVTFTQVALVARSAAGGQVDERATVLDTPAAVDAFAARFRTEAMREALRDAVASSDVPADETLVGAVVAVGCDVPSGVTVQRRDGGLALVPREPRTTHPECLVAVTSVALVRVASGSVPG